MNHTTNYGLPKMPAALTDPAAVYNSAAELIERGRTRLCIASETISAGYAVTMLPDGTYKPAEPGDVLHGVAASAASAGTQFFAICDVGVEITLDYASFTVGGSVYVGAGGELVQASSGYGKVGIATAANKVVLVGFALSDLNLTAFVNSILLSHGLITE